MHLGVNDNAYTNSIAKISIDFATEVLQVSLDVVSLFESAVANLS